ncbi:gamma-butyrobetaine hydroxylase-like domain-containing protein [Massilia suwonensis]|uniref:Gamma-butyrobetaine hydroxylase-like domain-containing protein n=1 Tax=Massilia suwonensis TaxID=648895 RepID=A0ABW0MUI3_9BURK
MPIPTELTVHQKSRLLDIAFDDGRAFSIPFELMRVYSPSAEVKGHGPGQEVLQVGKREVGIRGVEPVGNYAVKPLFTDGHESGIFTWDYLYKLGNEHEALWQDYMQRLQAAGFEGDSGREPGTVLPGAQPRGGVCGSHSH